MQIFDKFWVIMFLITQNISIKFSNKVDRSPMYSVSEVNGVKIYNMSAGKSMHEFED
jgi:hypothetical protein